MTERTMQGVAHDVQRLVRDSLGSPSHIYWERDDTISSLFYPEIDGQAVEVRVTITNLHPKRA